ncbi:hypothetical protein ABRP93_11575, partial [Corynebacterium sp. KPL2850]
MVVIRPLARFVLAALFLMFTTVRALLPVAGSGVAAFVTALVAIPASIIFYVASVAWVASNVAAFPLLKKAVAPVILALAAVVAVSLLTMAVATLLLLPVLAPPVIAVGVGIAAAFATVGVMLVCFVGNQLALLVTGLFGAGQLLLRVVTAGVMFIGVVFMATGVFAAIGPWIVRLVLRGVETVRAAISVGFIPLFAAPTRVLYPLRKVGTTVIDAVTAVVLPIALLTLPTLFLPYRGVLYRLAIPLTAFIFLLKWNFYSISVQVVAWTLVLLLAVISGVGPNPGKWTRGFNQDAIVSVADPAAS